MPDLPNALIESIARRRCIPYLGAGVSKHAKSTTGRRPDNWDEFLTSAYESCPGSKKAKSHIKKLISAKDYLTACNLIKNKLDEDWNRLLDEKFSTPAFAAGDIHQVIYDLDCPLVLTSNFDRIYETKAGSLSNGSYSIKHFYDEDLTILVRGDVKSRAILKIHGSINDKTKMIFTREDYAKQRFSYPGFFRIFESLLCTNTFFFIGCSLSDPDLCLLLENYNYSHGTTAPHYALMPKGIHQDIKDLWRKNYSLKIIEYNPKDNHAELLEILKDLQATIEKERSDMGNKTLW